jgi:hypothetical protein
MNSSAKRSSSQRGRPRAAPAPGSPGTARPGSRRRGRWCRSPPGTSGGSTAQRARGPPAPPRSRGRRPPCAPEPRPAVVVHQGRGVLAVHLQPVPHRLLAVVLALHHAPGHLRREAGCARRGRPPPSPGRCGGRSCAARWRRPPRPGTPRRRSRRPISPASRPAPPPAPRCAGSRRTPRRPRRRPREALAHHPQDHLVGHQLAGVHVAPGLRPSGVPCAHRVPQHVARGDLRDAQPLGQQGALRALSGTRGAEENQVHVHRRFDARGPCSSGADGPAVSHHGIRPARR